MPLVQVRNRKSRVVLGQVWCEDEGDALDALAEASGSSVEEIAMALGKTAEQARTNLEITVVEAVPEAQGRRKGAAPKKTLDHLPRRYG